MHLKMDAMVELWVKKTYPMALYTCQESFIKYNKRLNMKEGEKKTQNKHKDATIMTFIKI